jgi:hypothetical protein
MPKEEAHYQALHACCLAIKEADRQSVTTGSGTRLFYSTFVSAGRGRCYRSFPVLHADLPFIEFTNMDRRVVVPDVYGEYSTSLSAYQACHQSH